jgi:NAD-dependent DNA ligase
VLAVEWNTSAQGYLIPRIQFEPVTIGGAVIQYCTGHNARAILTGGVGPGAMICIRRSGDVIPTLESVVTPAVGGAVMPAGVWDGDEATAAHMRMATGTTSKELVTSQMGYFLKKLEIPGAGPSTWKELVDAGIDTPKKLWDTGAPRLSEILGPKTGATLHASLRTAFAKVDEQTLMIASSLMPRSVGETKLKSLFEADADPRRWTALTVAPESWSTDSLKAFQAVYPQYEAWRQQITWVAYPILKVAAAAPTAAKGKVESICFTGFRDKDLEAKLVAAGHVIHGAVTGKTTILVTPDDGAETEKIKKARATGVRVLKKSEAALL